MEVIEFSTCQKRLFQFIFYLLDARNEQRLFSLLNFWFQRLNIYKKSSKELKYKKLITERIKKSTEVLIPFVIKQKHAKELLYICKYELTSYGLERLLNINQSTGLISIKEICQDVIRYQMAQTVHSTKKAMKLVLNLPLPITHKCDLLRIRDGSWIEDLINEPDAGLAKELEAASFDSKYPRSTEMTTTEELSKRHENIKKFMSFI